MQHLARWYNIEHWSSCLNFVTPEQRHTRQAEGIMARRIEIDLRGGAGQEPKPLEPEDPELVTARKRVAQLEGKQPAAGSGGMNGEVTTVLTTAETAARTGVSPGRISQIQRGMEAQKPVPELAELMRRFNVKA